MVKGLPGGYGSRFGRVYLFLFKKIRAAVIDKSLGDADAGNPRYGSGERPGIGYRCRFGIVYLVGVNEGTAVVNIALGRIGNAGIGLIKRPVGRYRRRFGRVYLFRFKKIRAAVIDITFINIGNAGYVLVKCGVGGDGFGIFLYKGSIYWGCADRSVCPCRTFGNIVTWVICYGLREG